MPLVPRRVHNGDPLARPAVGEALIGAGPAGPLGKPLGPAQPSITGTLDASVVVPPLLRRDPAAVFLVAAPEAMMEGQSARSGCPS